jgi:pyrrolidone-carboxylate peptidase
VLMRATVSTRAVGPVVCRPPMNIDKIRQALTAYKANDGKVDTQELDKLMLQARDAGGLDATERAELISASSGFDDPTKQRLMRHLSAMGQPNAYVNLQALGTVTNIEGRYANLKLDVPGLTARVGLFDNSFAVKGKATADGVIKLTIEGKELSVVVKRGDAPAAILEKLQAQLPAGTRGLVYGGDVRPYDAETFNGAAATRRGAAAHIALYKPEALGLQPGEKPLRVVVTGYGAFMGITDNPSANMAQKLAELGVKGAIIEYRRLEVNHDAVNSFVAEMKRSPPDVILSMGVSSESQVEERPENKVGGGVDGDNRPITPGVVRDGAIRELRTDLPVEVIDGALRKFGDQREVGTSKSDANYSPDRSAYLCNYLGFNLADTFGGTAATTAGFVHVTDHTPTEQMHTLLESVVANQLEWRRSQRPVPPS